MDIVLVAAVARNGVIGRDGGLPWRLPSDLRRFRALTGGRPLVMGRRTWESLPRRPLPGRANIVVSGTLDAASLPDGAAARRCVPCALAAAAALGAAEAMVVGGAAVYAAALPWAARLEITEVDLEPDGDTLFPAFDRAEWTETARVPGEEDGVRFSFVTLERRR